MTDTYTGVIDRIVDGETAVLLLEADDEVVAQLDLPVATVPADGRHEGAVFAVSVGDGTTELRYQPGAEDARREAAQDRLDRLSEPLGEREGDGNAGEDA